jgi:hypothetical protein
MRMCIGFTDLNKACKKDPFPLPRIDTSVDKAVGCKCFFTPGLFLRSGSARKTRKKQVLLLLLEHTVTSECPKD